MTATERFNSAALDFAEHDRALLEMKRQTKRCTERSKPDLVSGDPGQGWCDPSPAGDGTRCEACQARVDNLPLYRSHIRARSSAKRKMQRWYPEARKEVLL